MSTALIVFGAKYLIWVLVAVCALYFFFARRRAKRKLLLLAVISLPLAYVVGKIAGRFYFDPRPFVVNNFTPLVAHTADNGFPSDHTLFAAALATLVLMFNRRLGLVLWVAALLIGVSRVLAGVHHAVDIVGGAVIAFGVVVLVYRSIRNAHWYRG